MAAKAGGKPVFSLSGNPAAAIMSLLTVLQPCLRKLTGENTGNEELLLPLRKDMPKFSTAVRMLRGHGTVQDGVLYFEENEGRGNGVISSYSDCSMIGIVEGPSAGRYEDPGSESAAGSLLTDCPVRYAYRR